jgi:hypothetical protein
VLIIASMRNASVSRAEFTLKKYEDAPLVDLAGWSPGLGIERLHVDGDLKCMCSAA